MLDVPLMGMTSPFAVTSRPELVLGLSLGLPGLGLLDGSKVVQTLHWLLHESKVKE